MKTNASISELNQALEAVNKIYDGRIGFRDITRKGNRVQFTLKAVSGQPGARVSPTGRNIPSASWHVHGQFFDELFKINPCVFVDSLGKRITRVKGNWEDYSIGYGGVMASDTSILLPAHANG